MHPTVCCSSWGHAHPGASGRLGIDCMVVGMIPRVFAFRTQGMQRLRWAAQADNGPVGEPVFRLRRTTKAVFDDFRQWVADDPSEVACDEVITHARVKAILDTLHSDQLHTEATAMGSFTRKARATMTFGTLRTSIRRAQLARMAPMIREHQTASVGERCAYSRASCWVLVCANCRFPSCKCAAYVGHSLT